MHIQEFDKFKILEDEIIHFKHIATSISETKELTSLKEHINTVRDYEHKEERLKQLMEKFNKDHNLEEYTKSIQDIESKSAKEKDFFYQNKKLNIKYVKNHYYIPTILADDEKIDYMTHIIKVKSERVFLERLESYLEVSNNYFSKFDWWMFSKIDETLDEIYIPYENPGSVTISKFKPDFIFWLQKGNDYTILFIDPKGTEYSSGYQKIDGYKRIFIDNNTGKNKVYHQDDLNITVRLLLMPANINSTVLDEYEKYWFKDLDELERKMEYF
jgi:hypothetical protein